MNVRREGVMQRSEPNVLEMRLALISCIYRALMSRMCSLQLGVPPEERRVTATVRRTTGMSPQRDVSTPFWSPSKTSRTWPTETGRHPPTGSIELARMSISITIYLLVMEIAKIIIIIITIITILIIFLFPYLQILFVYDACNVYWISESVVLQKSKWVE